MDERRVRSLLRICWARSLLDWVRGAWRQGRGFDRERGVEKRGSSNLKIEKVNGERSFMFEILILSYIITAVLTGSSAAKKFPFLLAIASCLFTSV
jgi:hypothetical protein